ncbi:MAG: Ig-like domain-containing protein, partial [Patescibacteria group bacterium]
VCGEYHSILHYVDPSDPLGDSPKNPSENAQYTNWETAITSWMERQNTANPNGPSLTRCDVPTEEDDVHTKVNEPEVRIEWVSVDTREVEIRLEAEAPRGVSRIEYFINGAFVAQTDAGEGGAFTLPSWVGTGKYNVTATAYDDVDNAGSDEFEIDVESEAPEASIAITSPINGQDILKTQTTYLVVVEVDGVSDVKSVELRVESTNGSRVFDGKVENPSSPFVTFTWTLPDEGIYTLSATLKREGDEEERADDVRITVTDQLDASAFDLAQ